MRFAADSPSEVYAGSTPPVYFKHIAEYYSHASHVQPFIQDELKIPEQIRIGAGSCSSGHHKELGIDATMALVDPQSIRFEPRVKAGQAEISGNKFESLAWLQDIGRRVADVRVTTATNADRAAVPRRCQGTGCSLRYVADVLRNGGWRILVRGLTRTGYTSRRNARRTPPPAACL